MCDSFEGPEKKLEIEFTLGASTYSPHPSPASFGLLRTVPLARWHAICALVHCNILSHKSNPHFDAYVLSESSLFVYPQKVLIKTCGTTTLLACVDALIAAAAEVGLRPESVYYSRQRFIFPEKQPFPHTSFEHETARMNELFPHGQSHRLGDQQGDHWFLFHADLVPEKPLALRQDRNIEVMMRDLDPAIMKLFFIDTYANGADALRAAVVSAFGAHSDTTQRLLAVTDAARAAGNEPTAVAAACVRSLMSLDRLFPGIELDDHMFTPCGYSVNGLRGAAYLTMHFTPEPTHSFVSFDTNCPAIVPQTALAWLAHALRPGRMAIALFSDYAAGDGLASRRGSKLSVDNYVRTSATHCEFFSPISDEACYDVKYTHLRRDVTDAAARAVS